MCLSRLPFCENDFWHVVHWYGFRPMCVRICVFRLDFCGNVLNMLYIQMVSVQYVYEYDHKGDVSLRMTFHRLYNYNAFLPYEYGCVYQGWICVRMISGRLYTGMGSHQYVYVNEQLVLVLC